MALITADTITRAELIETVDALTEGWPDGAKEWNRDLAKTTRPNKVVCWEHTYQGMPSGLVHGPVWEAMATASSRVSVLGYLVD